MGTRLPHNIAISTNVTPEVMMAYFHIPKYTCRKGSALADARLTIYHPTGNPSSMQKIGTPIPKPTQSTSANK